MNTKTDKYIKISTANFKKLLDERGITYSKVRFEATDNWRSADLIVGDHSYGATVPVGLYPGAKTRKHLNYRVWDMAANDLGYKIAD